MGQMQTMANIFYTYKNLDNLNIHQGKLNKIFDFDQNKYQQHICQGYHYLALTFFNTCIVIKFDLTIFTFACICSFI